MKLQSPNQQIAWKSLQSYVMVIACVSPIAVIIAFYETRNNTASLFWVPAVLISWLALALIYKRPVLAEKYRSYIYFGTAFFVFLSASVNSHDLIVNRSSATVLGGYKIFAVLIALIAPAPAWIGYVLIGCCIVFPSLQALFITTDMAVQTNYRDPWLTIIYAILAFIVFKYRIHAQKVEIELIETKSKEKSLKYFSDISMAIRDLTNSPLQSIDLVTDLLEQNNITPEKAGSLLRPNIKKLHDLSNMMAEQHEKLNRPEYQQASFDSIELLKQKFADFHSDHPRNK